MYTSLATLFLSFVLLLRAVIPTIAAPSMVIPPSLIPLETSFQNELKSKVDAPFQNGVKRLRAAYRSSLDSALQKYSAQGKLEESLKIKEEIVRFVREATVPDTDSPEIHSDIAKLRNAWRAEVDRLAEQWHSALTPAVAAYVARLQSFEVQLTKEVKLEEAKAVKERAVSVLAMEQTSPSISTPNAAPFVANAPAPGNMPKSMVLKKSDSTEFGDLLQTAVWEWHESSKTTKPVGEVKFVDAGKLETRIHYIESWKRIGTNRISVTKIDGLYWIFEFHPSKKIATSVPAKGSIGSTTEIRVKR